MMVYAATVLQTIAQTYCGLMNTPPKRERYIIHMSPTELDRAQRKLKHKRKRGECVARDIAFLRDHDIVII